MRGLYSDIDFSSFGEGAASNRGPVVRGTEEEVISQLPAGYVSCSLASGFSLLQMCGSDGARGTRARASALPDDGPIQAIRTKTLRGFGWR